MEITVLVQRIRFECISHRFNEFLEISVVTDGDKGLHVELQTERRRKTDVRARGEIQRAALQFAVDVVFRRLSINVFFYQRYPLCIVNRIRISGTEGYLDIRCNADAQIERHMVVIGMSIVSPREDRIQVKPNPLAAVGREPCE